MTFRVATESTQHIARQMQTGSLRFFRDGKHRRKARFAHERGHREQGTYTALSGELLQVLFSEIEQMLQALFAQDAAYQFSDPLSPASS